MNVAIRFWGLTWTRKAVWVSAPGLILRTPMPFIRCSKRESRVDQAIIRTETGDFIPSNILLSAAELESSMPGREYLLRNELNKVADNYNII